MNPPSKTFAELRLEARASAASRFSRKELAQLTLFKDAHQESIVPMLRDCPVKILADGQVLMRAGEACETLYLVLSGRLRMQDPSSTVPDGFLKAGDSVGELFLMQAATVAWTIAAVEPTRLLAVDKKTAWALINGSHEIARNWLKLLAERSRVGGVIWGSAQLKASYKRHATLDDSTGLHNRLWLESVLPRQMTRSSMNNSPLALLLVEIDGFAEYASEHGADAADHARYAVAQTLINNVRPTDMVACYGLASFAIVLPDSELSGACQVAERIRHSVSEAVVMMSDDSILPSVTASVGAAQLKPSADAAAFLATAERALQSAKMVGGDRVGMQAASG